MSNEPESVGSVTRMIRQVQQGEEGPAQEDLFLRYYEKIVAKARKWVQYQRTVADEEDVALDAWNSVLMGLAKGEFTECKDRVELEKLLAKIAFRKAVNLRDWILAAKRHPGQRRDVREILDDCGLDDKHRKVAELHFLDNLDSGQIAAQLKVPDEEIVDRIRYVRNWLKKRKYRPKRILPHEALAAEPVGEPGPLEHLIASELFAGLKEKYRQPIQLLLKGEDVPSIAKHLNVCEETVRRRLRDVQKYWQHEAEQ